MHKPNGSEIIRDYLRKYPEVSNASLVHAIQLLHPGVYKNDESCRRSLREIRKEDEFKSQTPETRRTMNNFPDPFTHNQVETFYIDNDCERILIISDLHIPFYHRDAVEIALEYGKKQNVDTILILGDLMDFYSISRFLVNPLERDINAELEMGKQFLQELRRMFPDTKIYYKLGNHELWWERYVWTNAPLLAKKDSDFLNSLDVEALDIEVIGDKQDIRICESLTAIHGHEMPGGSSTFPAKSALSKFNDNIIVAHWHKPTHFPDITGTGRELGAWSLGCLCLLRPEYLPINKWILGFGMVITDGIEFEMFNKRIVNGKMKNA